MIIYKELRTLPKHSYRGAPAHKVIAFEDKTGVKNCFKRMSTGIVDPDKVMNTLRDGFKVQDMAYDNIQIVHPDGFTFIVSHHTFGKSLKYMNIVDGAIQDRCIIGFMFEAIHLLSVRDPRLENIDLEGDSVSTGKVSLRDLKPGTRCVHNTGKESIYLGRYKTLRSNCPWHTYRNMEILDLNKSAHFFEFKSGDRVYVESFTSPNIMATNDKIVYPESECYLRAFTGSKYDIYTSSLIPIINGCHISLVDEEIENTNEHSMTYNSYITYNGTEPPKEGTVARYSITSEGLISVPKGEKRMRSIIEITSQGYKNYIK